MRRIGFDQLEQVDRRAARERVDAIVVLLAIQSALGWLAVLGTFAFAAAAGAVPFFAGALAAGLVGPLLTLALAAGLTRFRRWARNGLLAFEGLVLLAGLARFLIGRGQSVQLVPLLTVIGLPLAIAGLGLSGPTRRAFAKPARLPQIATIRPASAPAERAA